MDAIEQHRCDACPGRVGARITLIPSMGVLYACLHHSRVWAIIGEYEIEYATEAVQV